MTCAKRMHQQTTFKCLQLLCHVIVYLQASKSAKVDMCTDVQLIIHFWSLSWMSISYLYLRKNIFLLPNISLCWCMRWENILNHWWSLPLQSSISRRPPLLIYYLNCMCEKEAGVIFMYNLLPCCCVMHADGSWGQCHNSTFQSSTQYHASICENVFCFVFCHASLRFMMWNWIITCPLFNLVLTFSVSWP